VIFPVLSYTLGVSVSDFAANLNLSSFFDVLSTNYDRNNKEFVSLIEGKKYPIYGIHCCFVRCRSVVLFALLVFAYPIGSQFHPEKPLFEWYASEAIPHSGVAIKSMQFLADFFISETRKNFHAFPSYTDLSKVLIYNYCPVFTDSEFMQEYVFSA